MIKIFEMFAGYGGASFALKKAGIEHEVVGYSEIDKFAIQCYEQNHKGKNFGDCIKINPNDIPEFDLLTGGFPCQSFSVAGKGLGEQDTRGTLFHEIIRIAEHKQPKYMLLENVKGFTFDKYKKIFNKVISELNRIGYNVYWKILNTKDYGIPQNRERVWFVCFRKDLYKGFEFPKKEELKIFVGDILEDDVDDKYYLSDKQVEKIKNNIRHKNKMCIQGNTSPTLCARDYKDGGKRVKVFDYRYDEGLRPRKNEVSPTLSTKGCNNECLSGYPIILTGMQKHQQIKTDGIVNCLPNASGSGGGHTPMVLDQKTKIENNSGVTHSIRVGQGSGNNILVNDKKVWRKLTPRECFRLMGFLENEINLEGISDSQLYKLAGNGWDINLVSKILKKMLIKNNNKNIFSF